MNVSERLSQIGIIPVVVLENVQDAAPLAKALMAGGLPAAEVTFRTAAAKEAMVEMKKACPELIVGAGTVLNTEQAREALEAGAEFIVSPGLSEEVVTFCQQQGVTVLPGCATASEVQAAFNMGLRQIKFFPAENAGGIKMIKALAAPFHQMQFMPTGGISEKNMEDYLKEAMIFCAGGSWMVKADLIKAGAFDKIEALCKEAARKVEEVRKKHGE